MSLTGAPIEAGGAVTGLGLVSPVHGHVTLQLNCVVMLLVMVFILTRLVPHKLVMFLSAGLTSVPVSLVGQVDPGHGPGSQTEDQGEEEQGPHQAQAGHPLDSHSLGD